jgi:iron uptake system EfeUOB component EfeO/EfeM
VVPVSRTDLAAPYHAYRRYGAAGIATLQSQVATLVDTVRAGDRAQAEQAWLRARLTWLRLGQDNAAYGAFGTLGRRIDGTSAGLAGGVEGPRFTGFHRVERDLWGGSSTVVAAADGVTLQRLVARLSGRRVAAWLPASKAGETSWILRVHEILEDALRDSLSGNDDYGSGTTLPSLIADVAATREDLGLLAPLLRARKPRIVARVRHHLRGLDNVVDGMRTDGQWPPLDDLTQRRRQRLNAALGSALEALAPVPDLLPIGRAT